MGQRERLDDTAEWHVNRIQLSRASWGSYTLQMGRIMAMALVLTASVLWAAPAGATHVPKVAIVYGDSLTWESTPDLIADANLHPTISVQYHSFPATAPCVWAQWLPADLAQFHPAVITIESAGNGFNSQATCMVDGNGIPLADGSPGFFANYTASLTTLFSEASAAGTKVEFFEGPPMLDPTRNADVIQVAQIAQSLAAHYPGVTVSTAPRLTVSSHGAYVPYMHCLTIETAAEGCVNHQIAIRTTITGPQQGLHFCPGGLSATWPGLCATYSSGEYRWAKATMKAVEAALR